MFEWPNRAVPGTSRSILTLLFHRFPVVYRISRFTALPGNRLPLPVASEHLTAANDGKSREP